MKMTSNRKMVFVAVVLTIAALALVSCGGKKGDEVYYCPMHPAYTSDRPGDCPICNMKLIERELETYAEPPAPAPPSVAQAPDICILHNCSMYHDGKPCPMLVVGKEGEKINCPICGSHVVEGTQPTGERKILYWTDPMIPGYRAEGPGKSPMGMDLVPVYEEDAQIAEPVSMEIPEGYAPILVTPKKQQLIGVKTSPVARKPLIKTIRTVGTIAHDPELYQAQAEYIQSLEAWERAQSGSLPEIADQAGRLVESAKIRLKHLGLSDELIAEMALRKEAEHSLLYAHAGEPVWMYAKLYEYDLALVRVGQEIAAEILSLPGKIFKGKVRSIDSMVDPMTRTTRVRAQLDDSEGVLRPDMYVNVNIKVDLGEVLVVPEEAVFQTGERNIIFVVKPDGVFEPRSVLLGTKAEGAYEIKSGALEGEVVVTSGNFLIDSESRFKGALESMSGGGHQHGQ